MGGTDGLQMIVPETTLGNLDYNKVEFPTPVFYGGPMRRPDNRRNYGRPRAAVGTGVRPSPRDRSPSLGAQ